MGSAAEERQRLSRLAVASLSSGVASIVLIAVADGSRGPLGVVAALAAALAAVGLSLASRSDLQAHPALRGSRLSFLGLLTGLAGFALSGALLAIALFVALAG